jgi:putative transposase
LVSEDARGSRGSRIGLSFLQVIRSSGSSITSIPQSEELDEVVAFIDLVIRRAPRLRQCQDRRRFVPRAAASAKGCRGRARWSWYPLAGVFAYEPHQAVNGAYPADLYTPSGRIYQPPPEPEYPYHDKSVRVTSCGRICLGRRKINLSQVFAGQIVGIPEVDDQIWPVSFLDYDLGYFDQDEGRVEPGPNPFAPEKV